VIIVIIGTSSRTSIISSRRGSIIIIRRRTSSIRPTLISRVYVPTPTPISVVSPAPLRTSRTTIIFFLIVWVISPPSISTISIRVAVTTSFTLSLLVSCAFEFSVLFSTTSVEIFFVSTSTATRGRRLRCSRSIRFPEGISIVPRGVGREKDELTLRGRNVKRKERVCRSTIQQIVLVSGLELCRMCYSLHSSCCSRRKVQKWSEGEVSRVLTSRTQTPNNI